MYHVFKLLSAAVLSGAVLYKCPPQFFIYIYKRNIFTTDFFPAICFFCSYPGVVYKPQSNNKTEVMDHRSEGGKKEHQYV